MLTALMSKKTQESLFKNMRFVELGASFSGQDNFMGHPVEYREDIQDGKVFIVNKEHFKIVSV